MSFLLLFSINYFQLFFYYVDDVFSLYLSKLLLFLAYLVTILNARYYFSYSTYQYFPGYLENVYACTHLLEPGFDRNS